MTRLSEREEEVAALVLTGASNRRIGDELGISDQTVKNHISNILKKWKLSNRTQLAMRASSPFYLKYTHWLIALVVLQVMDLTTTRYSLGIGLTEGNYLLVGLVTEWWFLLVKSVVVLGVGYWLLRRAPRYLPGATLFYFGLVIGNILTALRIVI